MNPGSVFVVDMDLRVAEKFQTTAFVSREDQAVCPVEIVVTDVVDVVRFEGEKNDLNLLDYLASIVVGSMGVVDCGRKSGSEWTRTRKSAIFDAEDMGVVPQAYQLGVFVEPEILGRAADPVNCVVEGAVVVDSTGKSCRGAEKTLGIGGVGLDSGASARVEKDIEKYSTRASAGMETAPKNVLVISNHCGAAPGWEEEGEVVLSNYWDRRERRYMAGRVACGRGIRARGVDVDVCCPARGALDEDGDVDGDGQSL
ncbi:hypothetical protein HYFRA_00010882 [Hymenoscyphus fraxineus]|uniref:Uncharacterized protein n=1 Tax=Hymenoscyphus fraxineus TaxID=746836 RepID=A0A9N9KUF7_9HELO|nr:hypothetical protein HYFRA_00010882 [Hymenoscyphus fraxineus]